MEHEFLLKLNNILINLQNNKIQNKNSKIKIIKKKIAEIKFIKLNNIHINFNKWIQLNEILNNLYNHTYNVPKYSYKNTYYKQPNLLYGGFTHNSLEYKRCVGNGKIRLVGIKNLGVTCYSSAVIQIFYQIPELRRLICLGNSNNNIFKYVQKIFVSMNNTPEGNYAKRNSCPLLEFAGIRGLNWKTQNDAAEHLTKFLQGIIGAFAFNICISYKVGKKVMLRSKKSDAKPKPKIIPILVNLNKLDVPLEPNIVNMNELVQKLLLPDNDIVHFKPEFDKPNGFLDEDFTDLEYYDYKKTTWEKLKTDDYDINDKSIKITKTIKNIMLIQHLNNSIKLPKFLIIVLKRFKYDHNTQIITKIKTEIQKTDKMNITFKRKYIYNLRGTILHKGTYKHGHYITCIIDRKNNKYYKFDDKLAKEIQKVLALDIISHSYVFLYEREGGDSADDCNPIELDALRENPYMTKWRFGYGYGCGYGWGYGWGLRCGGIPYEFGYGLGYGCGYGWGHGFGYGCHPLQRPSP